MWCLESLSKSVCQMRKVPYVKPQTENDTINWDPRALILIEGVVKEMEKE
jgi:hypothetical protein